MHSFPVTTKGLYDAGCTGTGLISSASGYASDGSGYYIFITNYWNALVYSPDGTVVSLNSSDAFLKKDANGNFYPQTNTTTWNYDDTLNRAVVAETMSNDRLTYTFALPNAQGTTSTYTVKLGTVNVYTSFGAAGISEYSGSFKAITEIDLPDTSKYTFAYDSGTTAGHYGQLTSMTLPTTGTISYSYAKFTDANGNKAQWIAHRTTPDSSTGWSYSGPSVLTSCTRTQVDCQQSVTITKPSGDNEVYTFTLNGGAWLTQAQMYNGAVSSANLLSTTTACYNFVTVTNGSCSYAVTTASPATNVYKLAETSTLPIPASNVSATTEYTWDPSNIGNLTAVKEWNFGNSPSNSPDRTTTISYLTGTGYSNAFITNKRAGVTVTNSSGATVAQTSYCYDDNSNGGGCGSPNIGSTPTGTTNHDDTNYGSSNPYRGNVTEVKSYYSTSGYLTTQMTYDITGQPLTSKDSYGNQASYSYTDHFVNGTPSGPTNAYPTSITGALPAGNETLTYYYGTGEVASFTDANNETTSYTYNDSFSRLTNVSLPNSGWTIDQYDVSSGVPTGKETFVGILGTSSTSCSNCVHSEAKPDPLGRTSKAYLLSDPDGQTETDTVFDVNGRIKTLSHAYRTTSDPTYGLETLSYDGLDRTLSVTHPDSNAAYIYFGAQITSTLGQTTQQCSSSYGTGYPLLVIDEVGNKRQSWTDAFGRLIEADEPDSTGALNKKTCYTYDLNNNRTGLLAADGSQTRSYTYDFLSRLTSETYPEIKQTTINYYYTASGGALCSGDPGAVCRRTDGRGITTTYTYDAMNRLTGKSYSDSTPAVTYSYDQTSYNGLSISNGKNRRTGMSDGTGQTAWSYDPVGNPLAVSKTINSVTKTTSYTYNLDGSLATITYPGGRTVTYVTGNAERPVSAKDNSNSINYGLNATYAPHGALASMQNGSALISTFFYNNRLEPCRLSWRLL